MSSLALISQAMPIFIRNDVLKWGNEHYRVIDANSQQTFLFMMGQDKGFPVPHETEELEDRFMEGDVSILENHKYQLPPLSLSSRKKAYAETIERFQIIKPIVESEGYLISSERGKLISMQMSATNISKVKIYRLLRAYWTYGQCFEAVSTHLHNCGAKGKPRNLTTLKPGKQRNDGSKKNAIRTEAHINFMHRAIVVFYLAKKHSLTYTYRRFITYCKASPIYTSDDDIPSLDSLRHVLKSYYSLEFIARKRYGDRVYMKDIRSLSGSATASAYGPGARFEIDATVLDVHVVCNFDRSRVLGRPILYIIIDLFSRLIVGFYIGFYSPSFRTATIALLSAAQDKSHFLQKYNISKEICSSWPAVGLPDALTSDKAELFGIQGSNLVEMSGMRIENTASGRSDAKGVVERHFLTLQDPFSGDFDGKSSKMATKKSGAIYGRLTASLSFDELQEIIVSEIILRNNCHIMTGYDCEEDIPDDMPLTPANVWQWGIENRTGCMMQVDEERMKVAVLPRDKATVNRDSIKYKGLFYTSPELEQLGWFIRTPNNTVRPKSVEILYDPMIVNQIYVLLPNSNRMPIVCILMTKSRAYIDNSFLQAKKRLATRKKASKVYQAVEDEVMRQQEEKVIALVKNAKNEKKNTRKKPAAQTKREIAQNKLSAREIERQKLIGDYSPEQVSFAETDSDQRTQDEFSNPDLDEFFNLNDHDKDVENETNGIDDE
jgi:hypothetical protein